MEEAQSLTLPCGCTATFWHRKVVEYLGQCEALKAQLSGMTDQPALGRIEIDHAEGQHETQGG